MKKVFTLFSLVFAGTGVMFAQNANTSLSCETANAADVALGTVAAAPAAKTKIEVNSAGLLYSNGPLVNYAGQGSGGADISASHDGLILYGFGHNVAANPPIRVADDFTVPAGQNWKIDSIVFFAYQTNSGPASTITEVRLAVRNASPMTNPNPSTIVWGDTTSNALYDSYFSKIYRTTATTFTSTARPIMANNVTTPGLSLPAGQYWLDWGTAGTVASGPWVPPITYSVTTITGDALQFISGGWNNAVDTAQAGATDDAPQGLPFKIYGTNNSAVNELYETNEVSVYPNPMSSVSTVTVSDNVKAAGSGFSFVAFDLIGNEIRRTEGISAHQFTISKNNLPTGMYIYEVHNGNDIIKRGKLSVE